MSTAPTELPAYAPQRQDDRRHHDPIREPVGFDPEAGAAAKRAARLAFETGQGLDAAVLAGSLAYERVKREKARRGAFFPLRTGQRIEGVSPEMVKAATEALLRWGGQAPENSIEEEALARALATATAVQARRAADATENGRQSLEAAKARETFEAVRERVRVHLVLGGSPAEARR